ncbi:MAG: efflux transporter outer membrane subunit [Burkholderiaceae bacterium]
MRSAPFFPPRARAWRDRAIRLVPALAGIALLAACGAQRGLLATVGPDYAEPPSPAAERWRAPMPHDADLAQLSRWWQRFDDPLLVRLIDAAQAQSPTIAQAAARIERARADAVTADATGLPALDLQAAASRSTFTFAGPTLRRDQATLGLNTTWELDLFGGRARQREAAAATLQSSQAAWHDARVSVAAETANAYLDHRACEQQLTIVRDDAASRGESLRLTRIAGDAGFQSPANVALSRAVAAEGNATLEQRRAQCEVSVKMLVALTGVDEPTLREWLGADSAHTGRLPAPARFAIDALPARVLRQRPDVAAAERDLAAASANVGVAEAQRYPALSLTGNITPTRMRFDDGPFMNITTWSIGPNLSLPLFDGGRRKADVAARQAAHDAQAAVFRAKVRTAAREVEEALVRVTSTARRLPDAEQAARGYRESFEAARVRQRAGLGSLIEAEEARRTALGAELAVAALRQEQVGAWIALYRAAGGGWNEPMERGEAAPATMDRSTNR